MGETDNVLDASNIVSISNSATEVTDEQCQQFAEKYGYTYDANTKTFGKPDGSITQVSDVKDQIAQEFPNNSGKSGFFSGVKDIFGAAFGNQEGDQANDKKDKMWGGISQGMQTADSVVNYLSPVERESSFAQGMDTGVQVVKSMDLGDPKLNAIKDTAVTLYDTLNNFGGKKSHDFSVDQDVADTVGGSYGGSMNDIESAAADAGQRYGLFSSGARKRANKAIDKARQTQDLLSAISKQSKDQQNMVNQMGDLATSVYNFQTQGGYDQRYARVAEKGGTLDFEPEILTSFPKYDIIVPGSFAKGGALPEKIDPDSKGIVVNNDWVPDLIDDKWRPDIITVKSFQPGGRIAKALDAPKTEETEQKSVIPEGSLHKNKHHMENADSMTKKGIPVVDDNSEQQAEIERNEIIFTKEITKKLEELYKVYYDENSSEKEKTNAAIDAGKLLTKEIMLNTDDRTGLISTLQQGGVLGKPSFEEWVADVNPNFVNDSYDLQTAYQYLPMEQLDLWKSAVNRSTLPEGTDWHLPSVQQIDDNTFIFLKKGKSAKDNPELQYEFDAYAERPDFVKEFKMKFDKDNNRWTYIRRRTK